MKTVATSNMLMSNQGEEAVRNWRTRAAHAQENLKALRSKVRYPLWGLDEGIRTLSRLPDWIDHLRQYPVSRTEVFESSAALAESLDRIIRRAYSRGRPPTLIDR